MAIAQTPNDEALIRALVTRWAQAVRSKDLNTVVAQHAPDLLMFDVPPPLQSKGIAAYRKTWDLFYAFSPDPPVFDIDEMNITAGAEVAFVVAVMRCVVIEPGREPYAMPFRLTIGLRKVGGQWTVTHEHHSIPAAQ
jgi:uncharacterized protein (TIGR02246 family)